MNIWFAKCSFCGRYVDWKVVFRFGGIKFDIMFFEKAFSFTHIVKCIQMENYCLLKPSLRFCDGTTKSCGAKFFTAGSPSSAFFMKFKAQKYIPLAIHNNLLWPRDTDNIIFSIYKCIISHTIDTHHCSGYVSLLKLARNSALVFVFLRRSRTRSVASVKLVALEATIDTMRLSSHTCFTVSSPSNSSSRRVPLR